MANLYFEKVFQAVGRMKVTMTGMMVGCIVNIILDPLIIFGIGPFPRLGIEGAALATGIGQVTPVVIYWIIYKIRPISVKIHPEYLKEGKNLVGRLYAIGVPAILNLALPSLLISALNGILAVYSQSYVVVLGIYYKLQTFIYLTANGIVQGMRPIIGFNYGAGEHKRVRKIYEITLIMCAVIMLIGTGICLAIPEQLIGLFSSNPETIRLGGQALDRDPAGQAFRYSGQECRRKSVREREQDDETTAGLLWAESGRCRAAVCGHYADLYLQCFWQKHDLHPGHLYHHLLYHYHGYIAEPGRWLYG